MIISRYGIDFDTETKETFVDGKATGFTFEDAQWRGPDFIPEFIRRWKRLNHFDFATEETAGKVLQEIKETHKGLGIEFKIVEVHAEGPFWRTVQRYIEASRGDNNERFSAGLIALNVINNGWASAMTSLRAELRIARILS